MQSLSVLPYLKGRLSSNASIKKYTWFQVGGEASLFFKPHDLNDLVLFLKEHPRPHPLFYLGCGSNVLVRDGLFEACVIRLGAAFSSLERDGTHLIVGGGCLDKTVALWALQGGLSGFEYLFTIPGTIGGAIAMNAGCFGGEIADHLLWVDLLDREGNLYRLNRCDLNMSYRTGSLEKESCVVRACFQGVDGDSSRINSLMETFLQKRNEAQPQRVRTGGSTFKNPKENRFKAWELIDQAGCRGLILNGAQMSEKHCNFMINFSNACAKDLEDLGEIVRFRVFEATGVRLEWEIHILGSCKRPLESL